MFNTANLYPPELTDIGIAAAADPNFAEHLIAALRLLSEEESLLLHCGYTDGSAVVDHRIDSSGAINS